MSRAIPAELTAPVEANGRGLPPLVDGERLDQPTFHARYEAMPRGIKAELIGGIVHMPSPAKRPHSGMQFKLIRWMAEYEYATPGTSGHDNGSCILDEQREPQPDLYLMIVPECGGQANYRDDWLIGAPELVVEVADSSEGIDLHAKKADYERAGVREYVVVALRQALVFWFVHRAGAFAPLPPNADGILCSEVFPGLWLDAAAFLRGDHRRVLEVLRQGLATPAHAAFVARLAAQGPVAG
jgi:Uma2 family endonuclease